MRVRLFPILFLLALLLPALALPAGAQQPEPVDVRELESLVRTLEDPTERERFVGQLRTIIEAQRAVEADAPAVRAPGLIGEITRGINEFVAGLGTVSAQVVDVGRLWDWLRLQVVEEPRRAYWTDVLGVVLLVLAAGTVAYYLVRWLTRRRRLLTSRLEPETLGGRATALTVRALFELLPVVAFALGALGAIIALRPGGEAQAIAVAITQATIVVQTLLVLARAAFTPFAPNLRLFRIADETAAYLYVWFRRFAYPVAYAWVLFADGTFVRVPPFVLEGIERMLGLIVAVLAIVFLLQNRHTIGATIRGQREEGARTAVSVFRSFAANIWHIVAVLYVLGTFLIWALEIPGGFTVLARGAIVTLVLLVLVQPMALGLGRLIERGLSVGAELQVRHPALQQRVNRYLHYSQRLVAWIVYMLVTFAILHAWGMEPITWLGGLFAGTFWDKLLTIGIVLAITFAIWEAVSLSIAMYFEATDEAGKVKARSARVKTLIPLARTTLFVVLLVIVVLTTLATLGVDVTPLLATAGIVGIAIGFGSQKLVQDVINGLFILFQNTISVGDVVEAGGHAGLVERISVRTIELRDLSGSLRTIPFSEVSSVINMTRDFAFALMDVGVAYREDVDDVIEVLRQLGSELEADPEFGQYILEPLEVLGLDSFGDSSIVIRVRIRTKPIRQWLIRREYFRRMKRRFDELGIEIPFPHRTLYFGVDKQGGAPAAPIRLLDDRAPPPERDAVEIEALERIADGRTGTGGGS